MVGDVGSKGPVLTGKYVCLEPLNHRHVDGLVAASAGDASLYQWSPVPPLLVDRRSSVYETAAVLLINGASRGQGLLR